MKLNAMFGRSSIAANAVLLVSIIIALLVWMILRQQNDQSASQQFELQAGEVVNDIEQRLQQHEQILLGSAGLFDANAKVSREQWHAYVTRLDLSQTYPGILGVGYSVVVPAGKLSAHIASVRAEGFPSYVVKPLGKRELYTAIIYLEPFSGRNLAAFGFDMFSEATRNMAMRRAGETGQTAITGKVKLVQETHGKPQAGFLMYVPVYTNKIALDAPAKRWQALQGFVYSPYRMNDLMHGILVQRNIDNMDFDVHDGLSANEDSLMYASADEHGADPAATPRYLYQRKIEAYGHTWLIKLQNRPGFEAQFHTRVEWLVLLLGLGISLALFTLTRSLANRREQALALAERMTKEVRENEQRWHTMLETSPTAARIALSEGHKVIFFNRRYAELLNVAPDNVIGINPASYYANREVYEEVIAKLARGEQVIDRLVELAIPGFGTKWTLASYFPMQYEGQAAVLGWFHDITELKIAEESLLDREGRVKAIVNTVVDGIVTIDEKGCIETFNPAAVRIFGYTQEEVIGQNVKMLMPEPYHSEHDGYLHNYTASGKAKVIGIGREVTGRRKDGSTFPMELAVSEMQVSGKRMFTGIVRDITYRKRVDRMKNEFISTVSHELRTPLTAIRGSLGLLNAGVIGTLPEQAKAMLDIASNNTERLLILINDILDIQKIEAGKIAFRFENMALMPLLEKAVADLAMYADQHGVHFEINHRLDTIQVYADRDRLMQVLANLMSNAAKFSPRNSKVVIAAAHLQDSHVRISITDYGSGIPEDFKSRIFQPFTQSDSSDTRDKGGTGLGLSITKAIVERLGGQIDFISREGIGSTFYIDLPEMSSLQKNATDHPHTVPMMHRACVLIVEDDPDVAALLRRMLTEAGFDSDIAYNAQQARQLLAVHSEHYRLMTLDLMLPDEDGICLLESLRREAATRYLPVVVVSVKADEVKHQLVGGALGVRDWLQKPFDVERLISAVKDACGSGKVPNVLHVEDETDVRALVSAMLQGHCLLTSVDTLASAREALSSNIFDLVLLDVSLPDGSGLDLIENIKQQLKVPRIVIFSATDISAEYAEKVSAVLVKSRTDNEDLLRILKQCMYNI